MPSIAKTQSSYMSPDSGRNFLAFQKKFFDSFVKENNGSHDIYGSRYSGVFKNFGSEILIESHKLLNEKIALDSLIPQDSFNRYFKVEYSDYVESYEQQNLIACVLRDDSFIHDADATIEFTDCSICKIIRSKSSSDPDALPTEWLKTTSEPTLKIGSDEIKIGINSGDDSGVTYYFPITNTSTSSTFVDLIDLYDETTGTLVLGNLTHKNMGRPFFMACMDSWKSLPNIDFDDNEDQNGYPLLTFGTDGHKVTHLYPLIYGLDNVPEYEVDTTKQWFIKVKAVFGFFQNPNPEESAKLNRELDIVEIEYLYSDSPRNEGTSQTITFDTSFIHMRISNPIDWTFQKPVSGDYDYDGSGYENLVYGYIQLNHFNQNSGDPSVEPIPGSLTLIPALNVIFDDAYIMNLEENCVRAYSGINIDASSDYRENYTDKVNGNMHDLGDFGYTTELEYKGLPAYYSRQLSRDIHRHHIELYSIRSGLDDFNTRAKNKQTAGLIIDSAIPKLKSKAVTSGEISIVYQLNSVFDTVGLPISKSNYLSEIVFIDNEHFGIHYMKGNLKKPKFIYHGNSVFSLGMVGFDPENEFGRVYCISNDSQLYVNDLVQPRPKRTLARICDIPTSFVQLMGKVGFVPNNVIDTEYVRTETPLNPIEKSHLWNDMNRIVERYNNVIIYDNSEDLEDTLTPEKLQELGYTTRVNIGTFLNLSNPSLGVTTVVIDGGENYAVGDTFKSMICGRELTGTVTGVDDDEVSEVELNIDSTSIFPISNLDMMARGSLEDYKAKLKTTTIDGIGTGLQLALNIPKDKWESLLMEKSSDDIPPLLSFRFGGDNVYVVERSITPDENDNYWINDYIAIGDEFIYNPPYTKPMPQVLVSNLVNSENILDPAYKNRTGEFELYQSGIQIETFSDDTDYTYEIQSSTTPFQDTYVFISYSTEESEEEPPEFCDFCVFGSSGLTPSNNFHYNVLPDHHRSDFRSYVNTSNSMSLVYDSNSQVELDIFDYTKKNIDTYTTIAKDIIKLEESLPMSYYLLHKEFLKRYNRPLIALDGNDGKLLHKMYTREMTSNANLEYMIETISNMSREEVVEAVQQLSPNCRYLRYEGTPYQFRKEDYVSYYIEEYCTGMVRHLKTGLTCVANKDDIVCYDRGDEVFYPTDEKYRPKGHFISITSTLAPSDVTINDKKYENTYEYIFMIEGPLDVTKLSRIEDECGNTISTMCLIINKLVTNEGVVYNKYVYNKNSWVLLSK